jgi:hypothetical protein
VTNLRKQLDAAKSDYLAHRYPGNLANDVLPVRSNRLRLMAYAAPLLAAAAAWLIYTGTIQVNIHIHDAGKSPIALNPTTPPLNHPTTISSSSPTASINNDSLIPQYIELTPSSETLSVPAIQLVPSWDDVTTSSSTTSTTQESV